MPGKTVKLLMSMKSFNFKRIPEFSFPTVNRRFSDLEFLTSHPSLPWFSPHTVSMEVAINVRNATFLATGRPFEYFSSWELWAEFARTR